MNPRPAPDPETHPPRNGSHPRLIPPALTAAALTAAALTAAAALTLAAATPTPSTVRVTITNIRTASGQIRVAICPKADFLHPHCPYQAHAPAHPGAVTLTMPNIPPGTYAAQAFQDENSNGRLDQTWLGLPAEPMGFSNNAPLRFGPPTFAAAAFPVAIPQTQITFALRTY